MMVVENITKLDLFCNEGKYFMRSKVYFSKDRKCAKMAVCNFLLWLSIITFFVEKELHFCSSFHHL